MGAKNTIRHYSGSSQPFIGGSAFRSMLNDLKRRPEDAARELGVPEEEIAQVIKGEKSLTPALIEKAAALWPVSQRDFYRIEDDCPQGVLVMDAAASEKSSRVMERGGKPYYEYRDTAMSRAGFFRPEWIKELCVVEDNDPENNAVQWNNGHFLHQFTYFIGPVNFYYRGNDGRKKVAVMETGDSMYITPFVPHSFTTRANNERKSGLILALTYGNKLSGDAQQELSILGQELASRAVLDVSSTRKGAGTLLHYQRELGSVTLSELSMRAGVTVGSLQDYESGKAVFTQETIARLARALRISPVELYPPPLEERVMVQKCRDARRWRYPEANPAYEMAELAGTKHLPYSRSLEVTILPSLSCEAREESPGPDLSVGLHQYGYNIGQTAVNLHWKLHEKEYSQELQPGSSFYMKPYVGHSYRHSSRDEDSGREGRLLVLRIGGRIAGEALRELSVLGKEAVSRIVEETSQWFNPEGRKEV